MTTKSNFTQIPNSLLRCSGLDVYDKALFCLLASYNPCFPSYAALSEELGISFGRISKSIKKLLDCSIISYEQGSLKAKKNNEYIILPESDWKLPHTSLHHVESNNTKNNTNTAGMNKTAVEVNSVHQELLNKATELHPGHDFLKGKQDRLNSFGSFTAGQLSVIQNLAINLFLKKKRKVPLKEKKASFHNLMGIH